MPCALTGKPVTIDEADADHAEPYRFHTLVTTFLTARCITPSAHLLTAPADNQYERKLVDRDLARAWIEFHHELAHIRIVAREVNIADASKSRPNSLDRQLRLKKG